MNRKKLIPLAAMLVLTMTGCGRTSINLNDYVTISYDGYDTIGTASYTFDREAMIMEHSEAFGMSSGIDWQALQADYLLYDCISGSLDKTTGLSNGDTITFHWDNVDIKTLEENYKIKLNYSDISESITGLETAETFDPFTNIGVIFEGTAPNGTVKIQKDASALGGLNYVPDKNNGLSNGDEITVTLNAAYGDSVEDYCRSQGKIPSVTEKKFTVSGLPSYAMSLDEIPQESIEKMDNQAQETFRANVAKSWTDSNSMKGISLIGNYLLSPKDSSMNVYTHNYLYFVYKIDAENWDNNKEVFSYYYYTYFTDIMLLEDGTCSFDLSNSVYPRGMYGSESFSTGKYHYEGYQDLDTLFNKQVTSKIDQYIYESTVQEG